MTSNHLLAHLGKEGKCQPLDAHLFGVALRARAFGHKLGLPLSGELIGLLHDLGKASPEFQRYLRSFEPGSDIPPQHELRGKIDHSTAGAYCLVAEMPGAGTNGLARLVGQTLALCIASHHSGLIDCLAPDGSDRLDGRLHRADAVTRHPHIWGATDAEVRARVEALLRSPDLLQECNRKFSRVLRGSFGDSNVQFGLLVRMLFSCLIDADRTDTANFVDPQSARHRLNGSYASWDLLLTRLDVALTAFPATEAVDRIRGSVSQQCFKAGARRKGMYTLTVPTGGGKTLAALRFALEHARIHDLERIVFVSPYISIVDQNAAVARSILEPNGVPYASVVLEHHSEIARERALHDKQEPDIDGWRRRVLAENWDAPVVFTTMVQVLEAFFGAGTRSVRRLHALARSVVVFDEVQTLPVSMVHLFNNAINLLTTHCEATVLLCTATQPLLDQVDEARGRAHLTPAPELIEDAAAVWAALRRYTVCDETGRAGGWTQEDVARRVCEEALRSGSCLAVVNTKGDARAIFQLCRERLGESATVVHLSTGMCPAHRTDVLADLKLRLPHADSNCPTVCVSTQLIEAGVDIDFAVVVRDLAGLDSLAQAAGRCNRHGRRPEPGRVILVDLPEPPPQLAEIREGRRVARMVLGRWRREHPAEEFPLDSTEAMQTYYRSYFFDRRDDMMFDVNLESKGGGSSNLLDLLGANSVIANSRRGGEPLDRGILLHSFHTANEAFALMQPTQGIVVPYRERGKEIVNKLCGSFDLAVEWQLLRQAQPFTVSVYEHQFGQLQRNGAVYEVGDGTGVFCLRPEFYHHEFGLRENAGPLEDLLA